MGRRPLVQAPAAVDDRESPGHAWGVPHLGEGTVAYIVGRPREGEHFVWAVLTYPRLQELLRELGLRRPHAIKVGREFLRHPTSKYLGRLPPPDHDPPGYPCSTVGDADPSTSEEDRDE